MKHAPTYHARAPRIPTALLSLALALALLPAATPAAWAAPQALTTNPTAPSAAQPSYDSRELGYITPVRLQEPWGACWAFGSLAAMEANLVMQGLMSNETHLSTRHLVYFAGTPVGSEVGTQAGEGQYPTEKQQEEYPDNPVFELGGHALEVASTISSGEGVAFESDYPFQNDEGYIYDYYYAQNGTWSLPDSERFVNEFMLRNMHRLPNYTSEDDAGNFTIDEDAMESIKAAIVEYGAASVSYCSKYYDPATAASFTNEPNPNDRVVDHDVCVVGWIDDFPLENFTTGSQGTKPEGNGAWIVKNSWGAETNEFPNKNSWGENGSGYFYLSFYDRSVTDFVAWEMAARETSIINQYDYMGQRSNAETRVTDYEPVSYANIFKADENQTIEAVSVNTYAPNTQVKVDIYLLKEPLELPVDPTEGTLLASLEATPEWSGYHYLSLQTPVKLKEGDCFAVVVSATEPGGIAVASIEAGNNKDATARFGLTHYDVVICNEGETCVLATIDGVQRWVDGTEFAALLHEGAEDDAWFGNACIKVYANPYIEPDPAPQPAPDPKQDPSNKGKSPLSTKAHATAKTADAAQPALLVLILFLSAGTGVFARVRRGVR